MVSPQFHCSNDDLFETTTETQARSIPKSQWQYKVGFIKKTNKPTNPRVGQELGNIPFSTEVIPPIVLTQPCEGGYEGDMIYPEQNEDDMESVEEEDEESNNNQTMSLDQECMADEKEEKAIHRRD
jgi:hypothetical protein